MSYTPTIFTEIWRNGISLGIKFNISEYIDMPDNRNSYTYKIISWWNGAIQYFTFPDLYSDSGWLEPLPDAPENVTATTDQCEKVTVMWNTVSGAAGYYVVIDVADQTVRYEKEVGNTTSSLEIKIEDYNKFTPFRNYRAWVYSINDCDEKVISQYDTVMFVGSPEAPDGISVIPDNENQKIIINWNDNGTHEDGFIVRRTLFDGSSVVDFIADMNVTQYVDSSPAMCKSYKYFVLSQNACAGNTSSEYGVANIGPDLSTVFTEGDLTGSKGYYTDRIEVNWDPSNSASLNAYRLFRKPAGSSRDSVEIATIQTPSKKFIV